MKQLIQTLKNLPVWVFIVCGIFLAGGIYALTTGNEKERLQGEQLNEEVARLRDSIRVTMFHNYVDSLYHYRVQTNRLLLQNEVLTLKLKQKNEADLQYYDSIVAIMASRPNY